MDAARRDPRALAVGDARLVLRGGTLKGFASGTEVAAGDALVPASVEYVGTDPAMEVRVVSANAVAVESVAPAVFADPDARLGFAYVMNKMDFQMFDDPREKALRDAVHRSVRQLSG